MKAPGFETDTNKRWGRVYVPFPYNFRLQHVPAFWNMTNVIMLKRTGKAIVYIKIIPLIEYNGLISSHQFGFK